MWVDLGLLITAIAALVAVSNRKNRRLGNVLMLVWVVAALQELGDVGMAARVTTSALLDFAVAGVAVAIITEDPTRRDAQVVGGVSMALMLAHFTVSAAEGNLSWLLYASICNAAFVLQCLTVRGWLDGMGLRIARFFGRIRPLSLFRVRRR